MRLHIVIGFTVIALLIADVACFGNVQAGTLALNYEHRLELACSNNLAYGKFARIDPQYDVRFVDCLAQNRWHEGFVAEWTAVPETREGGIEACETDEKTFGNGDANVDIQSCTDAEFEHMRAIGLDPAT